MAEGNPSFVANRILGLLRSEDFKEIGPFTLLQELERIISTVQAMLPDAEKKGTDRVDGIKDFLMDIEDVLYDADNLLEKLSSLASKRRSESSGNKTSKLNQVRRFFSTSNSITFRLKTTREIDEIKRRLEAILQGSRVRFFLRSDLGERSDRYRRAVRDEAPFLVDESKIVSRHDEKRKIVRILLETGSERNIEVLPIVGMGGIGKTTVAQLVFNCRMVMQHFERRLWVCVSEDFDIKRISIAIVESWHHENAGDVEIEALQSRVRDIIDEKRFLIVLDDVWNEDRSEWLSLMSLLAHGARGSKIIVTTRSKKVASIAGTIPPIYLHVQTPEESWILFKLMVFNGEEPTESYQKKIGMEIVNKCQGIPLAIKQVGSLLRHQKSESDWMHFYHDFSSLSVESQSFEMIPLLRLSYETLPSLLKNCFAYCSLFPKDYEFDVQMLIKLWMAQGFIESQSPGESLEDVGYRHFFDLFRRSFFQDPKRDLRGRVIKCRMHDLMHDLAIHVAGKQCKMLSSETESIDSRTSHVSLSSALFSAEQIPASLIHTKKIRSILFPCQLLPEQRVGAEEICESIVSRFRLLRTLDLHALGIKKVSDSIGKLSLLKYLDLSENGDITELPASITKLVNLQTLRLSSCFRLNKLPRDIANLVNLRHLEIDGCNNLAALPQGIGQLTNLQTLSQLVVTEDDSTRRDEIKELEGLNLKEFELKNLRHGKDGLVAYLSIIREAQSLYLEWESRAPKADDNVPLNNNFFSGLRELTLISFWGETLFNPGFPSNLVRLTLRRWLKGKNLGPLEQCSKLKVLVLDEITDLEYIMNDDRVENASVSSGKTPLFLFLEELWLTELPNLRGWWKSVVNCEKWPSFPCISKLVIEDCPNLASVPLFSTLEGLVVDSTCWNPFHLTMEQNLPTTTAENASSSSTATSSQLSTLKNLCIIGIDKFGNSKAHEEIAWDTMKSLILLKLDSLPEMTTLPEGLQHASSLQELHIWRCGVQEIPAWIGQLTSLKKLTIRVCPKIKSLPQEICSLDNLKTLEIEDCPMLIRRCEKQTGADWDKIKGIRDLHLGR